MDKAVERYKMVPSTNMDLVPVTHDLVPQRAIARNLNHSNSDTVTFGSLRKPPLKSLLKKLLYSGKKFDTCVQIGVFRFECHYIVLRCYTDYFENKRDNTGNIYLTDTKITPCGFAMAYEWMMAINARVKPTRIVELFNAATEMQIKLLIDQCWCCFDSNYFIEDRAFDIHLEAHIYDLPILSELMLPRVRMYFLTLVASENFFKLNSEELCALLRANTIGVNSEIEIFMAATYWLNYKWNERFPDFMNVLRCIRFGLLPLWFLAVLNRGDNCFEVDRIISHPCVKQMIRDGIMYSTYRFSFSGSIEEFKIILERVPLNVPDQRKWITDANAGNFYRHFELANLQKVEMEPFLHYLQNIRSQGKRYWVKLQPIVGNEIMFK